MRTILVPALVLVVTACDRTLEVGEPAVTIGVLAPRTGSLAETGETMAAVATLAAEQINQAGGADGHRVDVIVVDVGDAPDAAAAFAELIDQGALAVVGPATQDQVASVVPAAVAAETVFVSPVSTTPWRQGGRPADDGYMLRVVASDELQTLAIAYYLREIDAEAPIRAAVLTESFCDCGTPDCNLTEGDFATEQALGVFNYFDCFFTQPHARPHVISDELLYARGIDDTAVGTTVNRLNSLDPIPDVVVLAGVEQDALRVIARWIADHANDATDNQLRWVTTATTKTPGFVAEMPAAVFADLPAEAVPVSGSAPTAPLSGRAYRSLERAYRDAIGGDVSERAFAANVWDAVYLLAAAMTRQNVAGEPLGGPGLRDAVGAVSSGGPILHAGQWVDLTAILRNGGDVDFDGASGPLDLDADGEVVGPYEIWAVRPGDAGGFVFERELYIDARNVPSVLATFGVAEGGTLQDLIASCEIPPPDVCP